MQPLQPNTTSRLPRKRLLEYLAILLIAFGFSQVAFGQGTSFTYQGQLNDAGNPATGVYDFTFSLFNAASGGSQVGSTVTNVSVAVTNGLFSTYLDFGAVFNGGDYWLELGIRTNGATSFLILSGRQQITPTPYAIMADAVNGFVSASQLTGLIPSGSFSGTYNNALTLNNPANILSGNGSGLTALNASELSAGTVPAVRLGSGTADGTTVLYGDNVWRTPPTGSGDDSNEVYNIVVDNTIDPDTLASPNKTNFFMIDSSGNPMPLALGSGFEIDSASNLNVTATGSGDFNVTNIIVSDTNTVVLDLASHDTFKLLIETNFSFEFVNAPSLTHAARVYFQQDTNGGWSLLSASVLGGILRTNTNLQPTTNVGALDVLKVIPGFFPTNLVATLSQDFEPSLILTNLPSGGGSGAWTMIAHADAAGASGDTTSAPIDTTGANLLVAFITGSSISAPSITDNKFNTWTDALPWAGGHIAIKYCVPTSVGLGHTVTVQGVSGCNIQFYAVVKTGGTPFLDSVSAGSTTGDWQASTLYAGSLTPSTPTDFFITGVWFDVGSGVGDSCDSAFNLSDSPLVSSGNIGADVAYKIKISDSSAENPGWTRGIANNSDAGAYQACFK